MICMQELLQTHGPMAGGDEGGGSNPGVHFAWVCFGISLVLDVFVILMAYRWFVLR